ncbi:hypothetical protein S83_031994 [Arachis hypogaea]
MLMKIAHILVQNILVHFFSLQRHPHHSSTASLATILSILTLKNDFKQLEVFLIKWFSFPKSLIYNVLFASCSLLPGS